LFSLKDTKEFLDTKDLEKYFDRKNAGFTKAALGFNLSTEFGVEQFEFPFNGEAISLYLASIAPLNVQLSLILKVCHHQIPISPSCWCPIISEYTYSHLLLLCRNPKFYRLLFNVEHIFQ